MDDVPGEFAERLIAADVGTWSYDPRADRLHADPVFARLLGLSDADASGGALAAVFAGVHPQDQERMARAFQTVIRTRLTFAAQFRVIGRDGVVRTVVGRAHAELDATGHCARLPGILIDVSAQREAEARAERVLADAAAADARFRAFFEHSAPFAAIAEPDGTLVEANEGACEGCGFARSGVLGTHVTAGPWWTDDADSRATVTAAVARARDGDIVRERVSWRCGAGVARHMELALRPVLDGEGRLVNLAATGLDVTDQVRMERRLRESEARYRLALDAAELGTWRITPERELVVDERFSRIFSGEPDPIDFDAATAIVHAEDRERIEAAIGRAVRADGPAPYDEEYRVVHPRTGEVRWVQARGRARFEGEAGRPLLASFDGTLVDITERRRVDDELRELAGDLAEADRRKDEFLATLAHELRNPLAPISNALQILTHGRGPDARRTPAGDGAADEAIATLERQVLQMTRLVNDLMDVSRISRGRIELERVPVTLAQVFDATVEGSRPMIDAGGHELVVSLPEPELPLEADVTRLAQALVNLVHNAVKYSEPGSRVEIRARRAGACVEIDVLDEGIGIAADRIEDIFRMFVQIDGSTSRAQGGLGIGLALVERFVALHGGEVSVRSPGEGRGATFRVSLPVAESSVADPSKRAPSPPAAASAAVAPRRVLVVDDNEDGARTWVTVLGMRGHAARAVHDGFSALAAFADFRPDTVLLDIGMPGMDGHETCRRLRALPGGQDAHIVAVTGWGSAADRERSAASGFDRHLVKPVRVAELFALFGELPAARNA